MIGDCEAWRREAPQAKAHPDETDIEEYAKALFNHIAVCERCQRDREEHTKRMGTIGGVSCAFLAELTSEIAREMRINGWDSEISESTIQFVAGHTLMVAERWKIIKFNESMLAVRSEAAAKHPKTHETPER